VLDEIVDDNFVTVDSFRLIFNRFKRNLNVKRRFMTIPPHISMPKAQLI
jgi:hypothetical protein